MYNLGVRNAIRANPIFFNQRLGIDNYPDGVTKNDAGDGDTGANQLQNFPFISSVDYGATNLTVHGILKSTPNTTFDLDVFESPSCTPRPRRPAPERVLPRLDAGHDRRRRRRRRSTSRSTTRTPRASRRSR